MEIRGECQLVLYADDFALVAADLRIESLKSKVKVTIKRIGHRKVTRVNFRFGQVEMTSLRAVKYLGISLDEI